MLETGESKYIVPRGDGQGDPIVLDIAGVVKAEARLQDVAHVNLHTAAELLSTFNENWLLLQKSVTLLTYERNKAENTYKVTRAETLLDMTDEKLKAKGHSKSSADLREAMVEVNPRVNAARDRIEEIRAVLEYLRGKQQAFENAYNSVKKLVATPQLPDRPLGDGGKNAAFTAKSKSNGAGMSDDDISALFETGNDTTEEMPPGFEEPTYGRGR